MHITNHPILKEKLTEEVSFYFNNNYLKAKKGQTVATALMANGIRKFGVSRKLLQARGLYCANGRCMSCFVTINGLDHVVSCQTLIEEDMHIFSNDSDPDIRGERNES
ncbi:MAG TPA: (2Fe-2S)-binding protein [Virgibacillus sp.]|nr:(2Fe-2S)-binding protein [Virgibacillus sp.]HLR66803.1 (2Fe-2S)-binding protein [Virgibacillus sp.]